MAIPCQGFTFTWGGSALSEIRSLEFERQLEWQESGMSRNGRSGSGYKLNGAIRLIGFAPTVLNQSQFGLGNTLTISVPYGTTAMTLFSGYALYAGQAASATVNEAVSFAHTFKVWTATKALSTT